MAYVEGEVPTIVPSGAYGGSNGGFGWGSDWIVIILFAMIFGWGNGFGGYGNGNSGISGEGATLQRQLDSATNSLERKGDYIQEQICDGMFAMNTTALNGFNSVNTNILTSGFGIQEAINNANITGLQSANAIQSQLAQNNFNTAMGFNSIDRTLCDNACALTNTINNGFQGIYNQLYADKLEAKNELIANLRSHITSLDLAASQARQNQYLISQLRPTPEPAYIVPNPFTGVISGTTTTPEATTTSAYIHG